MRIVVLLISFSVFAIQVQAEPELKGSAGELSAYLTGVPKLVSLTGESELKIPADRALISLKVVTENKSLQEASRVNQEIRGRILKTLAEHGVPAARVKPSKFSSTPKYGMFREKAKSYRVENIVSITAQDEKEFQAVASLVDAMPEIRYESIDFEHSDKEGMKLKALGQAIEKAGEKRKLYEEKLGVKLSPKQFVDGGMVPMPRSMPPSYPGKALGYSARAASPLIAGLPEADNEEMPTSFSELTFTARVTVEYAVESR